MKLKLFHLGKSFQNECSLLIQTGKKAHKTLWDSGACKCVISLESYKTIPDKYKTEFFPSNIKIKAANGSIIHNNGECDITFRMGSEKLTFPFSVLRSIITICYSWPQLLQYIQYWHSLDYTRHYVL